VTPMTPEYLLFLDDERLPASNMNNAQIARSYDEAVRIMLERGCPASISFDHDLGIDKTGYDLARWLVERDLDLNGDFIPSTFRFEVHSQNPVGASNIRKYLTQYLEYKLHRTSPDVEQTKLSASSLVLPTPQQKG
jgi:hypothetical protein